MNYRKIWENHNGKIPVDERGVTYDIHHLDGNRKNNNISNLVCVSIDDHYKIHLNHYLSNPNHKDFASLVFLAHRLKKSTENLTGHTVTEETRKKISGSLSGRKRPKEVGEKISSHFKNYKWSKEDIRKRAESLRRHYSNMTDDEKKRRSEILSMAAIGKKLSESTKEKLSKHNSKLEDGNVLKINQMIVDGIPYKIISERFNISKSQITSIKQKKTYKWLW
jgi:hypothetical protein